MSVHKTDTGWRFRTRINGKAYSRSGFATKKEAQKQEVLFRDAHSGDQVILSFNELVDQYLSYCESKNKKITVYDRKNIITNHIAPFFASYKVDKILPKNVLAWQKQINSKGYSYEYRKKITLTLVNLFNYAVKYQGLNKSPCYRLSSIKRNEARTQFNFWTLDEFRKFISVVDIPEWKVFFTFLYYTGLRLGEAQALSWNDFDQEEIIVNKTYSVKGNKGGALTAPKTSKSNRRVLCHRS